MSDVNTLVGRGSHFEGKMTFEGVVRIDGSFEGEIVSREEILETVWGYEAFPSTRTIDNFIVRLRKRFEKEPESPLHLHTARGVGYRFTLKGQAQ